MSYVGKEIIRAGEMSGGNVLQSAVDGERAR